jgi:hypothetical protein
MSCKRYGDTLIEVAATGAEPRADLRAHLQACPSCRKAFEQERILFASIDAGLRSSANAEILLSFPPNVRTLIDAPSALPRMSQFVPRMIFAIAAITIAVIFVGQISRLRKTEQGGKAHVNLQAKSDVVRTPSLGYTLYSFSPTITPLAGEKRRGSTKRIYRRKLQLKHRDSEVILPPDQETLLRRYADQLPRRNLVPFSTNETDQAQTEPLRVELIQIAQLDVKPLAEGQW